ncbi:MAG: hypothetical protein IJQ89_09230 [Bacteroidales bacterium]|nr:hypothetical protein [Bacteroidales bacterium]
MIKRIKESGRLEEIVWMVMFTLFCFGVSLFRFFYTDTKVFLFLNWNLFLAFVPWAIATLVVLSKRLRSSKIMLVVLISV